MRQAFWHDRGGIIGGRTSGRWNRTRRGLRLVAWLVLPALVPLSVGCGNSSAKKAKEATAVAQSDGAQEEEKEVPAAAEVPAPAPRVKKKQKAAPKAETPAPPPASTQDITKWGTADLDGALARKDFLFIPAVVVYSASHPDDAKRAADLDALVRKVGRWNDDATIPLPLPPGAFAALDKQAAGGTAQPGAAPAAKGMRFGFGRNRKKDKDN